MAAAVQLWTDWATSQWTRKPDSLQHAGLSRRTLVNAVGGEVELSPKPRFRDASGVDFQSTKEPLIPVTLVVTPQAENDSRRLSSAGQQGQPLFVIHGRPRDKLFGKHIHPAKKSQLDEKLQKI